MTPFLPSVLSKPKKQGRGIPFHAFPFGGKGRGDEAPSEMRKEKPLQSHPRWGQWVGHEGAGGRGGWPQWPLRTRLRASSCTSQHRIDKEPGFPGTARLPETFPAPSTKAPGAAGTERPSSGAATNAPASEAESVVNAPGAGGSSSSSEGSEGPTGPPGFKVALKRPSQNCCEPGPRHETEAARPQRPQRGPRQPGPAASPSQAQRHPEKLFSTWKGKKPAGCRGNQAWA